MQIPPRKMHLFCIPSTYYCQKPLKSYAQLKKIQARKTFKCQTITLDITIKPHYTSTINSRYHKISAFFTVKLFKGTGLFILNILIINILDFSHAQNEIMVRNKISQNLCVLCGKIFNLSVIKLQKFSFLCTSQKAQKTYPKNYKNYSFFIITYYLNKGKK